LDDNNETTTSHYNYKASYPSSSSTTNIPNHPTLDGYYHIEASNNMDEEEEEDPTATTNANNNDYYHRSVVPIHATKLTVTGPDVDGILASMTVALAVKGCSLVSLHAAKADDMGVRTTRPSTTTTTTTDEKEGNIDAPITTATITVPIRDVFYVVDRYTGRPFLDEELYDLAVSLLDALRTPMAVVGVNASGSSFGHNTNSPSGTTSHSHNTIEAVLAQIPTPPYATLEEQITIKRSRISAKY
jgi:hypothetical protein